MKNLNPVVCTLTSAQLARRGARWTDALRRLAVRTDPLADGVSITIKGGLPLEELRRLVQFEAECCKWMNLDLREGPAFSTLTITADTAEGVDVIMRMVGV